MFTCERVAGIEGIAYLNSLQEYAAGEQKGLEAVQGSGAAAIASYLAGKPSFGQDNGIHEKESQGRIFTLGTPAPVDLTKWKGAKRKGKTPPQDVPAFGKNGEILSFEKAVLAGKGYHPQTGESLIKHVSDKRTVGYDFQFAMPKSASLLWGLSAEAAYSGSVQGAKFKEGIEEAQRRGVQRALQYAHENGLIIARRSGDKTGHEGAGHVMFGQYEHKTSREGDPQVHTHNMLFNICIREDGTTGTLDNAQIKRHAGAIAALYRMEAANYLREELGLRVSKVDRNWEIDGVSEELIATFSKRREQVVDYLADFGIDDSAMHREAAKHAGQNTRKGKDEQPPLTELYGRWKMEASAKGWRFETLVEAVQEAADKKNRMEAEDWIKKQVEANTTGAEPLPAERPQFDMDEIKARAYSALISTNSVFEERRILKEVFEELQVYTDVDTAVKAVEALIESGDLVPLAKRGDDLYFTTAAIIEKEKTLLRNAVEMRGNIEAINRHTVDRFIDAGRILPNGKRAELKLEQKRAVRWLCSNNQIAIVQGRAGAGKSFMLATVADIHRAEGREVHAIAPSHKAKEVVANDAQIAQDMARAVAGFISSYDREKITINANTTIIVDEAGMIGLDDMEKLVAIAKETGARLILSGDTKQLQPIAKGAPMALLSKGEVCGATLLEEITRQQDERQREASVLMSQGDVKGGFKHYVNSGRVKFSDTAMDECRAAYRKDMEENPNATRVFGVFRNAHATKLNLEHREFLKDSGLIASEGWTNAAWTRGMNQRVVDREFCRGDRIIFGESWKLNDLEISNNTTATILHIDFVKDGEPTFTIKTDDGRTFKAKPSEMVGYRDEDAKDKTTPKIDYAYAQTVYSLQGSTFDRMFVFAGEAANAELAYVMMTRHKLDCQVFVDRLRIHDELAASAGKTMFLNKETGGAGENHTQAEEEVTDEAIEKQFLAECQKSSAKLNVCDFHETPQAFLGEAVAMTPAQEETLKVEEKAKAPEKTYTVEDVMKPRPSPFGTPRTMPRGVQVGPKAEDNRAGGDPFTPEEKAIAEGEAYIQQTEREYATGIGAQARQQSDRMKQERQTQAKARNGWVEITTADIDKMVRHDLVDYFERHHGFSYIEGYQPKDGVEGHILRHDDVGKVSVKLGKDGVWKWTTRAGDAHGVVFDYETWRYGGKKGHGIRKVFDNLRMTPDARPLYSLSNDRVREAAPPAPQRTLADRLRDGAAMTWIAEKYQEAKEFFGRTINNTNANGGSNAHLESRGIRKDTQADFPDQIGTEHRLSRKNPNGATFPHVFLDGEVVNYERKGPKAHADDKRSFTAMGKGDKRLGLLKVIEAEEKGKPIDYKTASRIYVAESQVDGLSLYQHDKDRGENVKGALLVSTFGNPSDGGLADLYQLAKVNPNAEFHLAMDNDKAGLMFTNLMTDVVREARGPQAEIVDRRPAPEFKDWNDQVQNKPWSNAEAQIDAAREGKLAEDRAKGAAERGETPEQTPAADSMTAAEARLKAAERAAQEEARRKAREEYELKKEQLTRR